MNHYKHLPNYKLRARLNGIKGADPGHGHGRRVSKEHALIGKIERILENTSL